MLKKSKFPDDFQGSVKEPFDETEKENEKAGLKHNMQRTKISPASHTSQLFGRIALMGTRRQEAGLFPRLAVLSRPLSRP